jgi:uncharacterized C2H2 Zn-finger protein
MLPKEGDAGTPRHMVRIPRLQVDSTSAGQSNTAQTFCGSDHAVDSTPTRLARGCGRSARTWGEQHGKHSSLQSQDAAGEVYWKCPRCGLEVIKAATRGQFKKMSLHNNKSECKAHDHHTPPATAVGRKEPDQVRAAKRQCVGALRA